MPLTHHHSYSATRWLTRALAVGALCAAGHYIRIPLPGTPVPLIIQPFGTFAAGILLGPWYGLLSQLFYVALLPFTAGASLGGLALLVGPTSGYIWGIVISSAIVGLLYSPRLTTFQNSLIISCIALTCVHLPGMLVLKAWYWSAGIAAPSLSELIYQASIPFLAGDTLKASVASFLCSYHAYKK